MKTILSLALIIVFSASCNNYYKVISITPSAQQQSIQEQAESKKYFILRNGNEAYAMSDILFTADGKQMKCTLSDLPQEHKVYVVNDNKKKLIFKKAGGEYNETSVLKAVHIYVEGITTVKGTNSIAVENLQKTEIIERDQQKTNRNRTIGILSAVVGLAIIAAIAISTSLAHLKF